MIKTIKFSCFLFIISTFFYSYSFAGFDEGYNAYINGDFKTARIEFELLVDKGDADAQYNLGVMHLKGEGVLQNDKTAITLMTLAAEQDFVAAQYSLGSLYQAEGFALHNPKLAANWFRKAADNGDIESQYYLGSMYQYGKGGLQQSFENAIRWYDLASKKGQPDAQYALAMLYRMGKGVDKNDTQSTKLFKLSATNSGGEMASFQLANSYYYGIGIKQSFTDAIKWYELASKKGNTYAMYRLGLIFANGYGVEKNNSIAFLWLRIASNLNHKAATESLSQLLRNMSPEEISKSKTISSTCIKDNYNNCVSIGENNSFVSNSISIQDPFSELEKQLEPTIDKSFFLDNMLGASIFGAIAALLSFILSFTTLQVAGINEPFKNKYFFVLLPISMLLIYFFRSYFTS